eukprot:Colp12_sorted_trinity150504_noHs@7642
MAGYEHIRLECPEGCDLLSEASGPHQHLLENYCLIGFLNSGCSANVYHAQRRSQGDEVAVKIIHRSEANEKLWENEVKIASKIRKGAHFCGLKDAFQTPHHCVLIYEYLSGGELYEEICKNGALSMDRAYRIFSELVDATASLHESEVAHRDIKPENVCFDANDRVRLIDYGSACSAESLTAQVYRFGTRPMLPPEVWTHLCRNKFIDNRAVDVWALGVCLFVMLTGEYPWQIAHVKDDKFWQLRTRKIWTQDPWKRLSYEVSQLLSMIFQIDARHRPDIFQVQEYVRTHMTRQDRAPTLVQHFESLSVAA